MRRSLLLIAILFSSALSWSDRSGAEVVLASHRAVHDLVLDRADADLETQNMRGQLFYDLSGSTCLGYNLTTRITTETTSKRTARPLVTYARKVGKTTMEINSNSASRDTTATI